MILHIRLVAPVRPADVRVHMYESSSYRNDGTKHLRQFHHFCKGSMRKLLLSVLANVEWQGRDCAKSFGIGHGSNELA